MNTTYTKQISIKADAETTWKAITETRFVQDFLPEVKKDLQGMGEYIRRTHPNATLVAPDYVAPGQAMGWSTGAGTDIRLPRKDVEAHIESVEVRIEGRGEYTQVTFEVQYAPEFGKHYFLAHRCVRGLFDLKLNVLKRDLETDKTQIDWMPAFS